MCCPGCQAVAQTIVDNGLQSYYQHRTEMPNSPAQALPAELESLGIYDHPAVQQSFVRELSGETREASLILEDIHCPACLWLNERQLMNLQGVIDVRVNYTTHRAWVRWEQDRVRLSEILEAIQAIGYRAHPYEPSKQRQLAEAERKDILKRLGIAGVLAMQVMILAVAMYAGDWWGMEETHRELFRRLSLLLTLPVLAYSGQPFFKGAWKDFKARRAGMDVPVVLGISLAFAYSTWTTVLGSGAVYFDSVVMFVSFLLAARFLETAARRQSAGAADALVQGAPASATRLDMETGQASVIPVAELQPGDRVLIRAGQPVPADGRVLEGEGGVDESLLTGEHLPRHRRPGDPLVGGSINVESPLTMEVLSVGQDTVLQRLVNLLDRAQTDRPHSVGLVERIAAWFVLGVLGLGALTVLTYWSEGVEVWLPTLVSVLIIACPCALSLATPAALAVATNRLFREGVLVTRAHAIETLAQSSHVVFDKTGTLTRGDLAVVDVQCLDAETPEHYLRLAASLEQYSEHPIAEAFRQRAGSVLPVAREVKNIPGQGLTGEIDEEPYYLGSAHFIKAKTGHPLPQLELTSGRADGSRTAIYLAAQKGPLAAFLLEDQLRNGAKGLVEALGLTGRRTSLFTGDHQDAAMPVARALGIADVSSSMSPERKLAALRELQARGEVTAMVGDGINDAPVLGGAQVSIAMGSAAPLSVGSADIILLNNSLPALQNAFLLAINSRRVIGQNLSWALAYNGLALPAAFLGVIPPWAAAIGMSLSSLVVVANALRLGRLRVG